MAISIPIVSEFVGDGVKKARQEFKQLETVGAKAQFALKKAALPATAALASQTVSLEPMAAAAVPAAPVATAAPGAPPPVAAPVVTAAPRAATVRSASISAKPVWLA